jgi:hypothetical protein
MSNLPTDDKFREALIDDDLVLSSELDALPGDSEESLPHQVLRAGWLTAYQIKNICKHIDELSLVCVKCKGRFRVPKTRAAEKIPCPHCSVPVSLSDQSCSLNEILINNPPLHLTNQVFLKLAVKLGIVLPSEGEDLRLAHADLVPPAPIEEAIRQTAPDRSGELDLLRKKCDASIRKKYPQFDKLVDDVELARFLARHLLVSIQILNDTLADQLLQAGKDNILSLRSILHDKKLLTSYQLESYLPRYFDSLSRRTWAMSRDPLQRIHARNILDEFDCEEDFDEEDLFGELSFQEAASRELQILSLDPDDEEEGDPEDFRPGNLVKKYGEQVIREDSDE